MAGVQLPHRRYALNKKEAIVPTLVLPDRFIEIMAVGLDVDGVQRDTAHRAYRSLCGTIVLLGGIPPSYETFVRGYSHDFLKFYRSCGIMHTVEEILVAYRQLQDEHEAMAQPFEDVAAFLAHLHGGQVQIFAVSGERIERLHRWFEAFGLREWYTHIASASGGLDKTGFLLEACQLLGVDPRSACYVGDLACDMRDARRAGLIPIGITRSYATRDVLIESGAALVVASLEELAQRILP